MDTNMKRHEAAALKKSVETTYLENSSPRNLKQSVRIERLTGISLSIRRSAPAFYADIPSQTRSPSREKFLLPKYENL